MARAARSRLSRREEEEEEQGQGPGPSLPVFSIISVGFGSTRTDIDMFIAENKGLRFGLRGRSKKKSYSYDFVFKIV